MQSWHFWSIAGLILLILEMTIPAFVFASFAVAALATSAAAAAGLGTTAQLGVFSITSILTLAAVRPFFVNCIYRRSPAPPVNAHALIGQSATVVDPIGPSDQPGRVKLGSEEWRAISDSGLALTPGTRVEILIVSSATLTVRAKP